MLDSIKLLYAHNWRHSRAPLPNHLRRPIRNATASVYGEWLVKARAGSDSPWALINITA
jgi:hypothetical protein